jgi:membrane associated rhomboid family serine protease
MFRSIVDDVKQNFTQGTMVTKLIIINVAIYVVAALLIAFSKLYPFNDIILNYFAIHGSPGNFLWKPWTFITNMFLHTSLGHILWNMIGLHLFGNIAGDLLGDKRILPLYIFGGLIAAITFILTSQIRGLDDSFALGASGSIMAIVMTAGLVAPDYEIRLLLIGNVKIKFIVAIFLFFDIIGSQGMDNSGGHYAHLGGMFAGFLFIMLYKKGYDILKPFEQVFNYLSNGAKFERPRPMPKMKVEYGGKSLASKSQSRPNTSPINKIDFQHKLDTILDKINADGYERLTKEEKDFLKEASKKG